MMSLSQEAHRSARRDSRTAACGSRGQDGFKVEQAHHKAVDDHLRQEAQGRDSRDTQPDTPRPRPRKREGALLLLRWLGVNV